VALRSAPGGRAVGRVGPRTQFGGPRVVSVLRRRGTWLQVVVPERPNARPAWIRDARARLDATDVSIRIDRSSRTLTVRDRGRAIQRVRIGVGAPEHPTPTGRFAVTDKLAMGGPGTTYGCCAIALSAHQPKLPATWNGLDRIAVHGTQSPDTIGVAASLGCMHASERDLRRLMRTVPLGAPVFIRA
jgi:lipoprotein-anchoring transpeptidase ErfK/SrfK